MLVRWGLCVLKRLFEGSWVFLFNAWQNVTWQHRGAKVTDCWADKLLEAHTTPPGTVVSSERAIEVESKDS